MDKRGTELSGLQVTIATSYIFNMLRVEWGKNGWSIDRLKYLTLALDCMPDEFVFTLSSCLFRRIRKLLY